jgi:imidazolonepropionase-like amidohydrolase
MDKGQVFSHVGNVPSKDVLLEDASVRVFHGKGRTLMPGLGDAHTHFTWNGGDLDQLAELGIEEHTLLTARSAECFLDSGYTMCFGAASAKKRLDVVIRDAINAGDIPGPRFLANGQEMARRGGELVGGITAFADGPEEMRQVYVFNQKVHKLKWLIVFFCFRIREHIELGVDQIKLSMSGESVKPRLPLLDGH